MARRFRGWTTVKFGRFGNTVRNYRRYGNKTYRVRSFYRYLRPKSTRRFQDYV